MNPFALARTLIDIPSTTGAEAALEKFLSAYLTARGYLIERQEVAARRANLLATLPGGVPEVVLSTHIDTVPPHIPSSEDADFIYGRGACDTKGVIAAQLCAADCLRAGGATNFGLLCTVDEEMSSLGARRANEHPRASECRYLINGEPTGNRLAIGSKGSLRLRLRATGAPRTRLILNTANRRFSS